MEAFRLNQVIRHYFNNCYNTSNFDVTNHFKLKCAPRCTSLQPLMPKIEKTAPKIFRNIQKSEEISSNCKSLGENSLQRKLGFLEILLQAVGGE